MAQEALNQPVDDTGATIGLRPAGTGIHKCVSIMLIRMAVELQEAALIYNQTGNKNVEVTAPYSHSGSVKTLEEAITAHYDPLILANIDQYDSLQRHEFAKVLAKSDMVGMVNYLTKDEVADLINFLKTLSF